MLKSEVRLIVSTYQHLDLSVLQIILPKQKELISKQDDCSGVHSACREEAQSGHCVQLLRLGT